MELFYLLILILYVLSLGDLKRTEVLGKLQLYKKMEKKTPHP